MQTSQLKLINDDKMITEKVGSLIAKARKSKGISQAELAKKVNISQAMICTYEQGARRIPITQFIKIAEAIGISPGKILDGTVNEDKKRNGRPSRRFLKRLEEIEKLPDFEKRALVKTIDAILFQYKEKKKNKRKKT